MRKSILKKALALVCVVATCVSCAVSASATSKTSNTGNFSTDYGTFRGILNCSRGSTTAAATAST